MSSNMEVRRRSDRILKNYLDGFVGMSYTLTGGDDDDSDDEQTDY